MSQTNEIAENVSPVPITDDAVGVPDAEKSTCKDNACWFIGMTKTNMEKRLRDLLHEKNYKTYLPIQTEQHTWSQNRKRKIERMVLPGYIFVHCTEEQRKAIFSDATIAPIAKVYLSRWMVNRASTSSSGFHQLATVPNDQMEQFMMMVEKSSQPVTIESLHLRKGDKVRVTRGELWGCIGELEKLPDQTAKLVIRINNLGAAKVTIDLNDIEIIN